MARPCDSQCLKIAPGEFGLGLFAVKHIPRERIIASTSDKVSYFNLRSPKNRLLTIEDIERELAERNLPSDLCFVVNKHHLFAEFSLPSSFYELTGTYWYVMNHCHDKPNVQVRLLLCPPCVQWVTTRVIQPGEELRFNYGKPDPDWNHK